ncbi:Uu.00g084460.m01.CDS01 [Anthostomella pinea]|uniref:Uu.00g084460.m01.CDS01 n=1 Tax=Anthostomella pinea TaxID=933095 RepID=A0AAI8YJP7_9PEZI|nr:Uu.00g084460.m01.CDS01 [Anthostomella pinea]
MSLMLCFRQLTRFYIKTSRPFAWEDVVVLAAYVSSRDPVLGQAFTFRQCFGLGESVLKVLPASTMFGREITTLSAIELSSGIKIGYARDLLFIVCLGFSKLSVYANLLALSPSSIHQ